VAETTGDSELAALRAGDEGAFQSLIQRYHGPMLRLALTYVGDRSVAEDIVQEAWLTCLRSLDRFEGRSASKVLGDETLRHVRSAIDALPPKQREVILLRDVAGFEAGEVSDLLGISAANERVRLHRARASVRRALEEYLR